MKILLTGATGFIGRYLYPELIKRKYKVICALRKKHTSSPDQHLLVDRTFYFNTLNSNTDFGEALENIDVVIHLAGRAHIPTKSDYALHKEFLDLNFYGTRNLAWQAAKNRVKRFVFISSISVNGKSTGSGRAFTEQDVENPYNSYTVSKLKAEQALRKIEEQTGMEVVIIRPPLVYGPEVKANFLKLLNLVHTRLPLPFFGIKNKRSFIAIDNLVDAIAHCAIHEGAGGQTFLVSDGQPLSTPQLLEKISMAMGVRSRLFDVPFPILKAGLILLNKKGIYDRLWGNLTVDSTKIRQHLDWQPTVTVDEGIQKTVQWYLKEFS